MEFKLHLEDDDLMDMLEIIERAALAGDYQAERFMEETVLEVTVEGLVFHKIIELDLDISVRSLLYYGDGIESYIRNKFADHVFDNAEFENAYMELGKKWL